MRARRQACEQSAECKGLGEHPRLLCTLKCLQVLQSCLCPRPWFATPRLTLPLLDVWYCSRSVTWRYTARAKAWRSWRRARSTAVATLITIAV